LEPADFINANIKLSINNPAAENMRLTVTTNRQDIISIGSYLSALRPADYRSDDILIPIDYIAGKIALTLDSGSGVLGSSGDTTLN